MKKSFLTITAIVLCIVYGVLSWDLITHSKEAGPEDSKFAETCSGTNGHDMCCIDYNTALEAVRNDWNAALKKLIDQEKPASAMVEEGYETLRTYNCWAEYICRAVQYSGIAPIESAYGTGLTSEHLGTVPGCQDAENLTMDVEYSNFIKSQKDVTVGTQKPISTDKLFVENKINYFPRCTTDGNNNQNPSISKAYERYASCKKALELNFGCLSKKEESGGESEKNNECLDSATAFVKLETVLRKAHADQKARVLEKKLGELVTKVHVMEQHVGYLDNFLTQLNSRLPCYAGKCG